jgi:hypothetical protein
MRQCVLRKHNRYQVAWIPAQFAVKGRYVRLKDDDGWKVETVGMYQKEVNGQRGYFAGGVGR